MQGIITGNISNLYKVKIGDELYEATARGKLKKDDLSLAVGDFVEVKITDIENKKAIIENIFPRKTYMKRPKIANISQIILVISIKNPKPDLLMLDKQLTYAEYLGINPVIVINKIDLSSEYKEIEKTYKKVGYRVLNISAKEQEGIDELKEILRGKINAFSGNSGVGKSTIINSILGENVTQEGNISQKLKRGKNTTTDIKFYEVDKDTYIADTPGFSTFDIFEIESTELEKYFREFKEYIKECQFVGCSHIKEQNCGVKKAVESGKISKERYDRFCEIYLKIKEKEKKRW